MKTTESKTKKLSKKKLLHENYQAKLKNPKKIFLGFFNLVM
jgi:hypothetical protein